MKGELFEWEMIPTVGATPAARCGHTSQLLDNTLYIYGGTDGFSNFDDLYVTVSFLPLFALN